MARLHQIRNNEENNFFGVALYNVKNGYNLGGAIRALGAFGGKFIVASGTRWKEKGDFRNIDTEAAHLKLPCFLGVDNILDHIPYGCEIVAVEFNGEAESLHDFKHPRQAVYLFGPEDGALPQELIAESHKIIYIPTNYSLNLMSAVNVVCYDRTMKGFASDKKPVICPQCGHSHFTTYFNEEGVVIQYHCNACNNLWGE